ncbi:MAG: hypothetical protein U0359_34660 [Byssovorax sp.]
MNDLLLYRLLGEPELSAEPLLPLLGELAVRPLKERLPFLGRLPRALAHADPRLRCAALTVLAGARGLPAFRAAIAALDDPAPEVRSEALCTLRASAQALPARFAHALFHPSAEVRRAALAAPLPHGSQSHAFYLLADPATGDELRRRIAAPPTPENAALDRPVALAGALPALLGFVAEGHLGRDEARTIVLDLRFAEVARRLEHGTQRSEAEVEQVLAAVERDDTPPLAALPGDDLLDALFGLFGDASPEQARTFFARFGQSLHHWPGRAHRRAVAALVATVVRCGPSSPILRLLAVHHPRSLGLRWIDRAERRLAADAIYDAGKQIHDRDEAEVRALCDIDLARRPSGALDLRVIGALLHFLKNHPFHRLLRWFGLQAVLDAFLEDIEDAAPLLGLPDDSKRGRSYLLERLLQARPDSRGTVRALLALSAAPGDDAAFTDLGPADAAEMTAALLRLVRHPAHALPQKRATAFAAQLAPRLAADVDRARGVITGWLDADPNLDLPLGLALFGALGATLDTQAFIALGLALDEPHLLRFLDAAERCTSLPHGKEVALAHALTEHASPRARAWAEARIPAAGAPPPEERPAAATPVERLSPSLLEAIALSSPGALPGLLAACFASPTSGLCHALARRTPGPADLAVCAALFASFDPIDDIDAQLVRFGSEQPAFLTALDAELVRSLGRCERLPLHAHAWLHCWEPHAFAAMDMLLEWPGLAANLRQAATLKSPVLRREIWSAAAAVLAMWRYRDRQRLTTVVSDVLGEVLVGHLDGDLGPVAAKILMHIVESAVAPPFVERLRPLVDARMPDLDDETRRILSPWIQSRGLLARAARRAAVSGASTSRERVRSARDLDELCAFCAEDDDVVVEEAALKLIEMGEVAIERLLALLRTLPPAYRALIETIALWPEGPSKARARALPADPEAPAELRFRLAIALARDGDRAQIAHALAAAAAPAKHAWFSADDWQRLLDLGCAPRALSLALAASPHPHAYRPAIEPLVRLRDPDPEALGALRAFLLAGSERAIELRRRAARVLRAHGDDLGFPLVLEEKLESGSSHLGPPLLDGAPAALVDETVEAILLGGEAAAPSGSAFALFTSTKIDPEALARALARMIEDGGDHLRRPALSSLGKTLTRARKLRAIAETFAWGVRIGRVLTGRLFRVQMVTGKGLGYTRLHEDRIFVSPLPLLLGAPQGPEVVEGLILHELGHHLYHRGEDEAAVWKRAEEQGLPGLLNLVADEHLERRLRAEDAAYGDRLKRLAAYAFQHTQREIPVNDLLEGLGARAFPVLSATRLDVARNERCVLVDSAAVLFEMERSGLSFIRFFRALRMGLGNRHDDPRVATALGLFKGNFRRKTMADLLALAHELRAIFGAEARLVEHFGPHEAMEDAEAIEAHGEGITQAEIDAEVERVLDPKRGASSPARPGEPHKPWINVNPDEHFQPITRVVKVPGDPAEHRRLALSVARASRQMRRYFEHLGLRFEPQRLRMQGRRFDRTRTLPVVLRGDPRMLIARELRMFTDLFLGVIIDCSGSMQTRGNIEKARLFGTMLAEAARDLRGVDLRILGFTDQVIYDAGDAQRPAAHALVADGGNNDAAALWHAAQLALASRRKARLLVMISDGLPTECSTSALKALVNKLGRRHGICCAQVAVQPLAEVCFPHYVLLEGGDAEATVHRFGEVVAKLVEKAMRG